MVEDLGEKIEEMVTPSNRYLYEVNEDCIKLEGKKAEAFHSVSVKALYFMKRTRSDIEPTVVFLTTRVSKSDDDDWNKLKRMLSF